MREPEHPAKASAGIIDEKRHQDEPDHDHRQWIAMHEEGEGDGGEYCWGKEPQPGGAEVGSCGTSEDRDWLAGTPWHKHTPAQIEAL